MPTVYRPERLFLYILLQYKKKIKYFIHDFSKLLQFFDIIFIWGKLSGKEPTVKKQDSSFAKKMMVLMIPLFLFVNLMQIK